MIKKLLFYGILLLCNKLMAQENVQKLILKTHVFPDGVALRWTPSNAYLWRQWSKNGFRVERYKIAIQNKATEASEAVCIGGQSILPYDSIQWQTLAQSKPKSILIQSCLGNRNRRIVNKADYLQNREEEEQCYLFSMLAMQSDFDLNLAAGLGIMDKEIQSGTTYLYKIYPINSIEKDTQYIIVNTDEPNQLPIISTFNAKLSEQHIQLEWQSSDYSSDYFAYKLERSMDSGKTYVELNETPLVPNISMNPSTTKIDYYTDSVSKYSQLILYRIRGISYFGQLSLPSKADSIIIYPTTKAFPQFVEARSTDSIKVNIHWQFDSLQSQFIKGFYITECDSTEGTFDKIDSNIIEPNQRSISINTHKNTCYFKVNAITFNETYNSSLPALMQRVDSFPPAIPTIYKVTVDSLGIVLLQWHKSHSSDVMAYKVYRGNFINEEFTCITSYYLNDTFISDTLFTRMIRDSVHYKVTAIDHHYNESSYSITMGIAVPNAIPPAPPVIHQITYTNKVVLIKWYPSNSRPIIRYDLTRINVNTASKKVIQINSTDTIYIDTTVIAGNTYAYTMQAINIKNLLSISAKAYEIKIPSNNIMPMVEISKTFNDSANNTLLFYWSYPYHEDVKYYRIVQKLSNGRTETIGQTAENNSFYTYYYLKPYTMTNYFIIAYFKDGRRSLF